MEKEAKYYLKLSEEEVRSLFPQNVPHLIVEIRDNGIYRVSGTFHNVPPEEKHKALCELIKKGRNVRLVTSWELFELHRKINGLI
jgi:hypothetical protein